VVRDQRDRGEGGPLGVAVSQVLMARGKGGPPVGDETIGIAESRDRTTKAERRREFFSHGRQEGEAKFLSHQNVFSLFSCGRYGTLVLTI